MLAALRLVLRVIAEVDQRVVAIGRLHDYVAATSAVAARRPAPGHKLLPPEGHAAVAAVAGLYANFCFINEHGKLWVREQKSEIGLQLTLAAAGPRCRLTSLPDRA